MIHVSDSLNSNCVYTSIYRLQVDELSLVVPPHRRIVIRGDEDLRPLRPETFACNKSNVKIKQVL